jgi:hypothetical protein
MSEFQLFLSVIVLNACVLGLALLVLYQANKTVSPCGR